jgi:DNA-binding transcriptional LysR family regulator
VAGTRGVDFNLLVPLHALLQERNVTRAGAAASMSQPAMSAALARLRTHFGDELLVRTGRTYELTPLAEQLLPQVSAALDAVGTALDPWANFDPATSTRRFTVSGSDYALAVLLEPLLAAIHAQAPGVTVDFDPIPPPGVDMLAHLLRRDLLLAALGYDIPGRRQVVFTDRFVCIVAEDNPRLVDGRLSLEDLAALPHVASFGSRTPTAADAVLLEAGVAPRVEVTVEGLLAVPFTVAGTDLCAFVPERLFARCPTSLGLVVAEVPLDDPELAEAAHWHPSRHGDPSIGWLRGILREVSATLGHRVATA